MNITNLNSLFHQEYGASSQSVQYFFAPGRVNLIGEHIDYNGGFVFPAALSLGIYGALRLRSDKIIQLKSTNAAASILVDLEQPIQYNLDDSWGNYPKGVIKYLLTSGYLLQGCDILFAGNLPEGAGLSSSAAILVLTAFMLRYVSDNKDINRVDLAKLCQKVENQFINVNCGIMDEFAVAMGRHECAILLDCEQLQYKYIPFVLKEHSLVIMNTNKKRQLAESKYNQRRSECEQALKIIQRYRPIANLCQVMPEEIESYIEDEMLKRRVTHITAENKRVLMAVQLLMQHDIIGFGQLLTQSHMSLKNNYEVTGFELDCIVDHALTAAGCIGARMTGAGFGGCAIALVENEKLADFKDNVLQKYQEGTGLTPDFYVATIADGVNILE